MPECVFSACLCGHCSVDMENLLIGCKAEDECLCIKRGCCCGIDKNASSYPIGLTKKEGNICNLGCFCCECGLKVPQVLCSGFARFLCFKEGCAFPFNEHNPELVCAVCFLKCMPGFGCMQPPFGSKEGAPPSTTEMER